MRMTCRRLTLLALLMMSLWLLGGCGGGGGGEEVNPPPDQVTVLDTVTEEVPSSGGTVSSDAVATAPDVQFPSGVLSSDATVTMQVLSGVPVAAPNSGLTTLGKPVSVAVDGADLAADGHLILTPNKPATSGKAVLAGYLLDGQWVLTPAPEAAGVSPAVTVMLPSEAQAQATSAARKGDKSVTGLVLGFFEFPIIQNNDPMRLYKWIVRNSVDGGFVGRWEAAGSTDWPDGQMTGSHQVLMVHGIFGTQDHFYQLASTLDDDQSLSLYAVRYSWGQHINVLGQKLAQIINQKVSEDNPIDIVAHSMGGLVSRSAIEQHNAKSRVRKLITCGSPHGGTPSAAVGVMFTSLVSPLDIHGWLPEAWDLVAFSPFLVGLNQNSGTPCLYKAMAGNVKTGSEWYFLNNLSYLGWLGDNDGMVEVTSALRPLSGEAARWDPAGVFATNHKGLITTSEPMAQIREWLQIGSGGSAPVVTLNEPVVDYGAGFAQISGTVSGGDSAQIIHNGTPLSVALDANGDFSYTLILTSGSNTVLARGFNGDVPGDSRSYTLNFSPPGGDFNFRVTLVWDGEGDVDLHTWDPYGDHSYFGHKPISTGELDYDNVTAYGPENFTNRVLTQGRYRIGVNAYSRCAGRTAHVRVTINTGANAGQSRLFGPYTFSDTNGNDDYPVTGDTSCWWRPCDITVYGNRIEAVTPDYVSVSRGVIPRGYKGTKNP